MPPPVWCVDIVALCVSLVVFVMCWCGQDDVFVVLDLMEKIVYDLDNF